MKNHSKKKICLISLGCPRNLVDSEVLLGFLSKQSYQITQEIKKADVILLNTCGFLQEARDEAYSSLKEIFHKKSSLSKVIITGCMVALHKEEMQKKFPKIFAFLPPAKIEKIAELLEGSFSDEISIDKSYLETKTTPRVLSTPPHYAYLKIAEGCRKNCSYCLIPKIKGPLKSRKEEDILASFDNLLKKGVFEIILIAQDLADYGKDFKEKNALCSLLKKMLERKQDFWIRLLYVYPEEISENLLHIMASDKRICPYIDMPLQHISNKILKSMRRAATKEKILDIIKKIRAIIPHIAIRTTFIVGFPGETEEDFQELVEFVKEANLDHVGVFVFSAEEKTAAFSFPNQIEESTKQQRKNILLQTQLEVVRKKNRKKIKKTLEVLIDGYHPESHLLLAARSQYEAPEIDGTILINDISSVDGLYKKVSVKITDSIDYDYLAKILKVHEREKI